MAVGIKLWVTEFCGNTLFEALRDEMLQPLGLVMDLLDGIVQYFVQKCLQQPMMAHDLQRAPPTGERTVELRDAVRIQQGGMGMLPVFAACS